MNPTPLIFFTDRQHLFCLVQRHDFAGYIFIVKYIELYKKMSGSVFCYGLHSGQRGGGGGWDSIPKYFIIYSVLYNATILLAT